MRPGHMGKNTSKHFEQILLKNREPPSYVLSDSTSQPCMGIMDGVTQLCWAWAVPVHNQPLPHTKSKSPVEVCIYIINNIYIYI